MLSAVQTNNVAKLLRAKARDDQNKHPKWKRGLQEYMCKQAIEHGHLEVLQCLRDMGCMWPSDAFRIATQYEQRAIFEWLLEQPWALNHSSSYALAHAIRWGDVDLVARVHANLLVNDSLDEQVSRAAAAVGSVEILEWLRAHDCPMDQSTMRTAIEHGHVDCVAWLRHQCAIGFGDEACKHAAKAGHALVLAYLHEQGCPWDEGVFDAVLQCPAPIDAHGRRRRDPFIACLRYLLAHGCPCPMYPPLGRRWWLMPVLHEHLMPKWRWMVKVRPYALHWLEEHAKARGAPGGVDEAEGAAFVAEAMA